MAITVADLIGKMAGESEFTFEVAGETLKAKLLADATDVITLERQVAQVRKSLKRAPAEWQQYLPADEQVIRMAVYCERLMIEPPMTFLDGLMMAKQAGVLFLQIGTQVLERATGSAAQGETEAIDDAKNE